MFNFLKYVVVVLLAQQLKSPKSVFRSSLSFFEWNAKWSNIHIPHNMVNPMYGKGESKVTSETNARRGYKTSLNIQSAERSAVLKRGRQSTITRSTTR